MKQGEGPYSLPDAFEAAVEAYMEGVHFCLPGRVVSYDATKCKADIKPLLSKIFVDIGVTELEILTAVPIVWPRGSGGGLHFPLATGDFVMILFSERNLENWLSGNGQVSAPADGRKFDLSDAIAVPGLYPFGESSPFANDGSAVMTFKGATLKMDKTGKIALGNSSGELFALLDQTLSALNALGTSLSALSGPLAPLQAIGSTLLSQIEPIKTSLELVKGSL